MNIIDFKQLSGDEEAISSAIEIVRRIRNEGRQWMTENSEEISPEEQRTWWEKSSQLSDSDFRLCLFTGYVTFSGMLSQKTHKASNFVGYGMLTRREDVLHISLAVDQRYRNQGYGAKIYDNMCSSIDEPVNAVILKNNIASIRAAVKAGFRFVEDGDKTVLYVRAKP